MYKGGTILVTGGTGSFGKTVTTYLLTKDCKEVRVFSRDEAKQDLMRTQYMDDPRVKFYIGDIRDYDSIHDAMLGVDYVFHAAALKQVPSCEFFPMQAVMTNIIGSDNVLKAAVSNKVKSVVCLSTDKAVYPVNAMGTSKAMMEKVAQAYARQQAESGTVISCVRYGNVMYSRGSVIPRFIEQIKANKPITITEPTMTRFLMELNEAVDLVDHAFFNANQGDVFIKKAPACTVEDLAQALKNLFKSNVDTKIIGMRHGEKLYETLASNEELVTAEDMGDYYRVRMDNRDLNYEKYFSEGNKEEISYEDYHSHNTEQLDVKQVEDTLLKLKEVRQELELWDAQ
ncbi:MULTISPECIES: polysaccharide biosynthesis protein [unclassified Oleiphilus]|uniref:polysaccharide biosynthesis protein n=1 Tax=unclassified Oleiphilus TaxID=2631174 RepID=UPI0007C249CA|nr:MULTISPECIES: polysaccharide biosynthesis protein [unclassified Oleiphilus]KZZ37804.1 UDP-glucose 4-epimerase [Oleiphilus sp. HI0117]KZZ56739.1 UDP-glucose 4-epimerase [Oleiphilus sp. HI0123]